MIIKTWTYFNNTSFCKTYLMETAGLEDDIESMVLGQLHNIFLVTL